MNYQYEKHYILRIADYQFVIRPEEREGFLKRLEQDPALEKTLADNVNDNLWASLEYAIRMNSNSIIKTFGIPESGKSTILQIVGYHLYNMIINAGKEPVLEITFDYPDTIHSIQEQFKYKKKDQILIIIQDEQNQLSGSESRSYQTQIDNLLKSFRAAQVFVLLASPDDVPLTVCNLKIEAVAKDIDKRVNWGIAYVPQRKKRKIEFVPAGTLLLEYSSRIEQFYSEIGYVDRKMEFIENIIAKRGLQTVRLPDAVLNEAVGMVIQEAKKRKLKTKEQVKALTMVLGVGTTNTTKTVAELAALEYESYLQEEKERQYAEEIRREKEEREKEKKRISKLVVDVAKDLYRNFDFVNDKKAFARLTKGYIIEHYPEDWQELVKHHAHMFALASYWQENEVRENPQKNEIVSKFDSVTTNRQVLRMALARSIEMRENDPLLAQRAAFHLIPDKDIEPDKWTISKSAKALSKYVGKSVAYGTLRKYLNDKKHKVHEIKENRKIWGDAGEFYFAEMVRRTVEKGKKEGWIEPNVTIEHPTAADVRSDGGRTDIFDVEVLVDGVSAAAVNVKFSHVDGQSFSLSPENEHESPWLFLISKDDFSERLIKCEKGQKHVYPDSEGVQSQSLEEFIKCCIEMHK